MYFLFNIDNIRRLEHIVAISDNINYTFAKGKQRRDTKTNYNMHHRYSVNKVAWWRKDSMENKSKKVEHSFKADFVDFIYNFTLHCYRWLVEPNQHSWE